MNTVYIPANVLSQVISDLQRYQLCNERYISLNPQWLPTEWDDKELQAEIPEITYDDNLQTVSMNYEVNLLGNSDMSVSDEYLYKLISALARYNPTMTGRSTPSLGSSNDYQRGRD